MTTLCEFRGERRDGTGFTGRGELRDLAGWISFRYHKGVRWLEVYKVQDGVQAGGISQTRDGRIWWSEDTIDE